MIKRSERLESKAMSREGMHLYLSGAAEKPARSTQKGQMGYTGCVNGGGVTISEEERREGTQSIPVIIARRVFAYRVPSFI
jgi:hypothetical protein